MKSAARDLGKGEVRTLDPGQTVGLGLACGVFTGVLEVALRGAQKLAGQRIYLSEDVVWMAPLADVVVFGVAVLLIVGVAALLGRRSLPAKPVVGVFVFLAAAGPALSYQWLHWAASVVLAAGLARILAGPATRFLLGRARRPLVVASIGLIALATILFRGLAWWEEGRAMAARGPVVGGPNVLLLVLDTVRAEDLGVYGYALPTTPYLERLAANGVLFERAYSTTSWTLPAHVSLFTGRYPHEFEAGWETPMGDRHPTLAEWFGDRGYATAGFAANLIYTTHEMGLDRGFTRYEAYPVSPAMIANSSLLARRIAVEAMDIFGSGQRLVRKSASELRERFVDWVDERGEPFFVFINFMDAHAPYLPPPELDGRFGPKRTGPALSDLSGREDWTGEELAAERAAYDGAIAYLDGEIRRIVDALGERGLLENTLIIVTSDHGEQFGEWGLVDHGNSLYRPVLHVPLIFAGKGLVPSGARVETPVSLRDVAATIQALVSGRVEFPGRSLAGAWSDSDTALVVSPALAELRSGVRMPDWTPIARGDMVALVADGAHYIRNGDGVEELYELDETGSRHDRADYETKLLTDLRQMADSVIRPGG